MFEKDINDLRRPCKKEEFISNIYLGYSKGESLAMMRMPPYALDFVLEEDATFKAALYRAEAYHIDCKVDKLLTLHEDFEDPRMVSAVSENIKFVAKTRKRDRYGDKTENLNTTQINLTVAISDARKRVTEFIDHIPLNTLEHQTDNISVEQPLTITSAPIKKPIVDPLS